MTTLFRLFFLTCFTLTLSACATNGTKLKVHSVNALSSAASDDGEFQGLEFLADPIPGKLKNRVNIFYLHGIGWTENPENDQLGNDFLSGVARSYDLENATDIIKTPCGTDEDNVGHKSNHIYVTTGETPVYYETIIPGVKLKLDQLVCMDKQTLNVDDNLEYVVYRIFWDDVFWRSLQSHHVGQDDSIGPSMALAGMRRKLNRRLKDEIVNFGFSDAVMYLGPAGQDIRNAIRGAMCSAALDAAGYSLEKQGHEIAYSRACQTATNTSVKINQFAFVTESLGSKITFDVMREAMTDNTDTIVDEMIAGSEVYMLANQIALLSLSDLSQNPKALPVLDPEKRRPRIVAFSEINDILTYEIGTFLEHLWTRRFVDSSGGNNVFDAASRESVAAAIGFDFVDLRLEFADPVIPFFDGMVDPMQAHMGHSAEPQLMLYMLCGARGGKLNDDSCLATSDLK